MATETFRSSCGTHCERRRRRLHRLWAGSVAVRAATQATQAPAAIHPSAAFVVVFVFVFVVFVFVVFVVFVVCDSMVVAEP